MFKSFKVDNARRVEFTGNNIQIPKSKWAYLRNNVDTFHTTGGEGTPDTPIPLVNIAEWNKTVCGENLLDISTAYNVVVDTSFLINGNTITGTLLSNTSTYAHIVVPIALPVCQISISNNYTAVNQGGIIAFMSGLYDGFLGNIVNGAVMNFTITTAGTYYLWLQLTSGTAGNIDDTVMWSNLQIVIGTYNALTIPPYQIYTGSTYSYKMEDVNGVLHEAGDLPDGTADTVNWETGEFVERKGVKVLDGTEDWEAVPTFDTATRVCFVIPLENYSSAGTYTITTHYNNTHFKKSATPLDTNLEDNICRLTDSLYVAISKTLATDLATFKTWLGSNNVTVQYKLATPKEPIQIKKYGETYGGVVWEYNEKPIQVEDSVCNVFSDKNVTMNFKAVSY